MGRVDKDNTGYAEMACMSNFSFLRGASHPEEIVVAGEKCRFARVDAYGP